MNLKKLIFLIGFISWTEIILAGNGKWSEYFLGFNFRKFNFIILSFLLCLYFLPKKFKTNFLLLIIIPIISFLFWGVFVPIFTLVPFNFSIQEGFIFFGFALMPILTSFYVDNAKEWCITRRWIFYCLIILSMSHIVLALCLIGIFPDNEGIISLFNLFLNPFGDNSLNLNNSYDEIRVGWISTPFIVILFGNLLLLSINKYYKLGILIIFFVALYYNGQRGLYFAFIYSGLIAIFLYIMLCKGFYSLRKYIFPLAVSLSVALIFFVSNVEFLELIGFSRPGSDEVRYSQSDILFNEFSNYFLFGKGLGASSLFIDRPEAAPYAFEQYILSLLMKLGILGVCTFFTYCILWRNEFENKFPRIPHRFFLKGYCALFFMLLFIFTASTSNPYLFNFVGLFFIYYVVIEYALLFKYNTSEVKL